MTRIRIRAIAEYQLTANFRRWGRCTRIHRRAAGRTERTIRSSKNSSLRSACPRIRLPRGHLSKMLKANKRVRWTERQYLTQYQMQLDRRTNRRHSYSRSLDLYSQMTTIVLSAALRSRQRKLKREERMRKYHFQMRSSRFSRTEQSWQARGHSWALNSRRLIPLQEKGKRSIDRIATI